MHATIRELAMNDAPSLKHVDADDADLPAQDHIDMYGLAIDSRDAATRDRVGFSGLHDCGPRALIRVVPELRETQILEAFLLCSEKWPHGGVSNKEFEIALKYLKVKHHYNSTQETLQDLLDRKPSRCVALLWGHFIAIRDGKVAGREVIGQHSYQFFRTTPSEITVYCSWSFH